MKTRYFIYCLTIVAVLFTKCKKEEEDYCAKWIGDWDFVTIVRDYYNTVVYDTIYYSGKIIRGNSKDELIFQYTPDDEILTEIFNNGGIFVPSCPCAGHSGWRCARGYFEGNDKVDLFYALEYKYNRSHRIIGTRKGKK